MLKIIKLILCCSVLMTLFSFSIISVYAENDVVSDEIDLIGDDSNSSEVLSEEIVIDDDYDGDTIKDKYDNCPEVYNVDQLDSDKDGIGDKCDDTPLADIDGDGVPDGIDNCISIFNPDQKDVNKNSQGDVCEGVLEDYDKDGIEDIRDNCPYIYNPDQKDVDNNNKGDACDKNDNEEDNKMDKLKFTEEPTFQISEHKIVISWKTNLKSLGAIHYGYKRDKLDGYVSDTNNVTNHSVSIDNLPDGIDTMYFSVISTANDEEIESDIMQIQFNNNENKSLDISTDNNIDVSDYDVILLNNIKDESDKLEVNVLKTVISLFTVLFASLVLIRWDEFSDLFNGIKKIFIKKDNNIDNK